MNYEETLDYLYERTFAFHKIGSSAYKPGLERSILLDDIAGNPHKKYKTIHIAGTNGKGSVAHLLAAILQSAGHKVGLYTSPHLLDFSERIRVNGRPITKQYVADFVGKNLKVIEREKPSFFELTTAMAFDYFRHKKVNYAIIETGMGGRLDSTNIITPILSIITSISFDHTEFLGEKLLDIAGEKAGIIKRNIPVIIGEMQDENLRQFFNYKAFEVSSPISYASHRDTLMDAEIQSDGSWVFDTIDFGVLKSELRGFLQKNNAQVVLSAIKSLTNAGTQIRISAVRKAFKNVTQLTGLMGRWQEVNSNPKVICDIGHNVGAWEINLRQLFIESSRRDKISIVLGISKDKDIDGMLSLMPKKATYYFTQASSERATPVGELTQKAATYELNGQSFKTVKEATEAALKDSTDNDIILISGSTFVVAEALPLFPEAIKS